VQPSPPPEAPSIAPMPPMMPPPKRNLDELLMKLSGVFLGIVIFAGLLSYHAIFFIPRPTAGTYPPPSTDPAVIAYRDTVRVLGIASMSLLDLAVGFSVALAWIAGTTKGEGTESGRRGIFIFATVFTAVWIIFSTAFFTSFLYSFLLY